MLTIEQVAKMVQEAIKYDPSFLNKHAVQRQRKIERALTEINELPSFESYWEENEREGEGEFDPTIRRHARTMRIYNEGQQEKIQAIIASAAHIQTQFGYHGAMGWRHVR